MRCLGLDICKAEADDLFKGLLEFAIEDGEISISLRAVQKALLRSTRAWLRITEVDRERRAQMRQAEAVLTNSRPGGQNAHDGMGAVQAAKIQRR